LGIFFNFTDLNQSWNQTTLATDCCQMKFALHFWQTEDTETEWHMTTFNNQTPL
jgi:ribosome-associated toxin RatA of RatAB toxin-antitoxin module